MENGLKKRYIILRSIVTVFLALCIFNLITGLTFTALSLSVPGEVYEAAEITKPSDITKTVILYYPESVQPVVKAASKIILYASPFPHTDFGASNLPSHPKAALQIVLWTNLSVILLFGIIWFLLRKLLYSMSLEGPPFTSERRKNLYHIATILIIPENQFTAYQIAPDSNALKIAIAWDQPIPMDEMGFAEMLRLLDTKLYSPHFMPQNPKAVFQFEAWYHIIILGLTVFLTTLLWSIFHRICNDVSPFSNKTFVQLVIVGSGTVLAAFVPRIIKVNLASSLLGARFFLFGLDDGFRIILIAAGFLVLAIAYIFRYGTYLQQESDETL